MLRLPGVLCCSAALLLCCSSALLLCCSAALLLCCSAVQLLSCFLYLHSRQLCCTQASSLKIQHLPVSIQVTVLLKGEQGTVLLHPSMALPVCRCSSSTSTSTCFPLGPPLAPPPRAASEVGIPTICSWSLFFIGRYFGYIWSKKCQKRGKNRKNCQKIRKTWHFNSIFLKRG